MQVRLGSILLAGSSVMALLAVVACTRPAQVLPEEDPSADPEPTQDDGKTTDTNKTTPPSNPETANTCLGKANLAFDNVKCNSCMSDNASCCAATIGCFKDTLDCGTLHTCILKCESGGGGGGTGGGDGGGGGNGGGGGGGGAAAAAAKTIFTTEVYPSVSATCASCHLNGTGGAPIYFGATADASYTLFKQNGYHLPNSIYVNKGLHTGPALTAAQRTLVDKWVAAETTASGGTAPTDGGVVSPGNVAACKDTCKAKYPKNVVDTWQTYNTCAAVTCKADCL